MAKSLRSREWVHFLQLLQNTRLSVGFTQQQLADGLNRPQSFVAKVEGGERRLDVVEFCQWMEVLEQSPELFLRKYKSTI